MNGASDHNSAVSGYTGSGTTWTNDIYLAMNHAQCVGKENRKIHQNLVRFKQRISVSEFMQYFDFREENHNISYTITLIPRTICAQSHQFFVTCSLSSDINE